MDDGGVLRSKNKSKAGRPVVASSSSNEHRWKYFLCAKLACDSVHKWDPRFRLIPKIGQNWFNGCRIGCYMLLWSVLRTNLPWRPLCWIIQWQWSKYLFIYSISVNVKKLKYFVAFINSKLLLVNIFIRYLLRQFSVTLFLSNAIFLWYV